MGEKSDVRFCLYLNCPLKVCEERIMERSKTSGRTDDNLGLFLYSFGVRFILIIVTYSSIRFVIFQPSILIKRISRLNAAL